MIEMRNNLVPKLEIGQITAKRLHNVNQFDKSLRIRGYRHRILAGTFDC